ncbi:MAG: His/Gly/Thr/Pro-type tRNA ligase C-terminal domain-containing protein, partial [Candidatus ainarchaeum sp.]|nr:His/Gly/Thr/Pro-type tRNA ligase C-terminal domain-containing protein [Candidatus ainarchaeum sp.]
GQKGTFRDVQEISAGELVQKGICDEIFAFFLVKEWEYYKACGLDMGRCALRHLLPGETPHYSKGNIDMEVDTSYGIIETIGNAYRTDFDLSQHQNLSKKDFAVFVEEEKRKVVPHVFELSMGADRTLFSVLEHSFRDKTKEKDWEWFDFPPAVAPYHVAVFPLMKKDKLDAKAMEVADMLRKAGLDVAYRDSGSIGRRYARADEIGIPYAMTIDYQTFEDGTVTIRYRNDGKQERVKIAECEAKLCVNISDGRVAL